MLLVYATQEKRHTSSLVKGDIYPNTINMQRQNFSLSLYKRRKRKVYRWEKMLFGARFSNQSIPLAMDSTYWPGIVTYSVGMSVWTEILNLGLVASKVMLEKELKRLLKGEVKTLDFLDAVCES